MSVRDTTLFSAFVIMFEHHRYAELYAGISVSIDYNIHNSIEVTTVLRLYMLCIMH